MSVMVKTTGIVASLDYFDSQRRDFKCKTKTLLHSAKKKTTKNKTKKKQFLQDTFLDFWPTGRARTVMFQTEGKRSKIMQLPACLATAKKYIINT